MRLKGISLPVNAVIVIALGIMVLLLVAAFFAGGAGKMNKATLENAWTQCCSTIQTVHKCNTSTDLSKINPRFDINSNGTTEDCKFICKEKFGLTTITYDSKECVCACSGCCT